jgi:hypothetical protein
VVSSAQPIKSAHLYQFVHAYNSEIDIKDTNWPLLKRIHMNSIVEEKLNDHVSVNTNNFHMLVDILPITVVAQSNV